VTLGRTRTGSVQHPPDPVLRPERVRLSSTEDTSRMSLKRKTFLVFLFLSGLIDATVESG